MKTLLSMSKAVLALILVFLAWGCQGQMVLRSGVVVNGNFLSTGLVSQWRFNEASGNAYDSTATGLILTNVNSVRTNGISGNGAFFFETNCFVSTALPGAVIMNPQTNSISLACWVYAYAPGSAAQTMVVKTCLGRIASRYGLVVQNSSAKAAFYCYDLSPYPIVTSTSAIASNQWTHLLCSYSTDTRLATFYINGVSNNISSIATLSSTRVEGVEDVTIGAFFYNNSIIDGFKGAIDDVRIYAKALNQTEVTAIYNNPQ